MNWKVGDEFWVDYSKISTSGGAIKLWKEWFPPSEQPFKIKEIKGGIVYKSMNRSIPPDYIYQNKNYIVTHILNDL